MEPDSEAPDPIIFVSDLQDVYKKIVFFLVSFAYYFLKVHLHNISYYFCLKMEGSRSGSGLMDPDLGGPRSVTLVKIIKMKPDL
jgi:hypothetical protein